MNLRVIARGGLRISQWSQLAIFFSVWLQVYPFGYIIFLIIPPDNEVGSIVFNLAAKLATTFKIPEGALPTSEVEPQPGVSPKSLLECPHNTVFHEHRYNPSQMVYSTGLHP